MAESVVIDFIANDKVTGKILQIGERLKFIGAEITRTFTMPFVNLARSLAAGVMQTETFKKAVEPINAAFQKIYESVATMLIPIIKELTPLFEAFSTVVINQVLPQFQQILKDTTPLLKDLLFLARQFMYTFAQDLKDNMPAIREFVAGLREIVQWFIALDPETKKAILNFIMFMAAIGPIIGFVGNLLLVFGKLWGLISGLAGGLQSLGGILPTIGAALAAISLPVWALIAAIILLIAEIIMFGPQAAESFGMLVEIIKFYAGQAIKEMQNMVNGMVQAVLNYDWNSVGGRIMMGIMSGIAAMLGPLAQLLLAMFQNAINQTIGGIGGPGGGGGGGGDNFGTRTLGTESALQSNIRAPGGETARGQAVNVNIGTMNLGDSKMTRSEMESLVRGAMISAMGAK